jgi:hypothetical protein
LVFTFFVFLIQAKFTFVDNLEKHVEKLVFEKEDDPKEEDDDEDAKKKKFEG